MAMTARRQKVCCVDSFSAGNAITTDWSTESITCWPICPGEMRSTYSTSGIMVLRPCTTSVANLGRNGTSKWFKHFCRCRSRMGTPRAVGRPVVATTGLVVESTQRPWRSVCSRSITVMSGCSNDQVGGDAALVRGPMEERSILDQQSRTWPGRNSIG